MSTAELIERIRPLPAEEKRELLERLWDEFGEELEDAGSELTAEQAVELDRRLEEFEANPRGGVPFEQVKAELRQRFGW